MMAASPAFPKPLDRLRRFILSDEARLCYIKTMQITAYGEKSLSGKVRLICNKTTLLSVYWRKSLSNKVTCLGSSPSTWHSCRMRCCNGQQPTKHHQKSLQKLMDGCILYVDIMTEEKLSSRFLLFIGQCVHPVREEEMSYRMWESLF